MPSEGLGALGVAAARDAEEPPMPNQLKFGRVVQEPELGSLPSTALIMSRFHVSFALCCSS